MQIRAVLGFDGTPGTCVWLVLLDAAFALSFSRISRSAVQCWFRDPRQKWRPSVDRSCSGLEGIEKASPSATGSESCWKRAATDSKTVDKPARETKVSICLCPRRFILSISKCIFRGICHLLQPWEVLRAQGCWSAPECLSPCLGFHDWPFLSLINPYD